MNRRENKTGDFSPDQGCKPFYVYFIPTAHHDLGYTHSIDELLRVYCGYYDDVLDFCGRTAGYPYEARYRYSIGQFWSLDHYLRHTGAENRRLLARYIREGRIEIPALYANVIDGICSREEIARLMYPSFAYAAECGVKIRTACLTDMPGMSDGMIEALSEAGVKYLFAGFPKYFRWPDCTGSVPPVKHDCWDEKALFPWGHPGAFIWRSVAGGEIFSWYQDGYGWFGDDTDTIVPHESYEEILLYLPRFIGDIRRRGAPYSVMRYIDHGSDNQQPLIGISDIALRWNSEHEDIKLIVGTNSMFFDALARDCAGRELPSVTGEMPHTDYTVMSLTEAQATAVNRRVLAQTESAEKLLALGGRGCTELAGGIYRSAVLYDEHCFGMSVSHGFANEYNRLLKINYANDAARKVALLWDEAAAAAVPGPEGAYTLFSPFAGKGIASGLSDEIPPDFGGSASVLKNRDGRGITVQWDSTGDPLLPVCGITDACALCLPGRKIREYTALTDAPAFSADNYDISGPAETAPEVIVTENRLENKFYRIELDRSVCGVTAVFDKRTGAYITDGEMPFGAVAAYDIGGDTLHMQHAFSMERRKSGPVADSVVIRSSVYSAPLIVSEITLYHELARIDFSCRITLDRTPLRELYICFPFAAENPEFSYQGTGAPIRAFDDILPGANTNHYTACGRCSVENPDTRIVLACAGPMIAKFGGLHPTAVSQAHHWLNPAGFNEPFITKKDVKNAHIYVMAAYNNSRTNFPVSQQGEVLYRFSVTSGKKADAAAFSDSFICEPRLLKGRCIKTELYTGAANISPVCMKAAEDGRGMILRLRETSGRNSAASLKMTGAGIVSASLCTLTEEDICPADPARIPIGAYKTVTVRIGLRTEVEP